MGRRWGGDGAEMGQRWGGNTCLVSLSPELEAPVEAAASAASNKPDRCSFCHFASSHRKGLPGRNPIAYREE